MYDVFISYTTDNVEKAREIRRILAENHITLFFAPDDIRGSEDHTRVVPQAIRNSKCFLLLMSKEAQQSSWVKRELGEADDYNTALTKQNGGRYPIFVLYLDDAVLREDYRFILRFSQSYSSNLGFHEQMRRFIHEYKEIIEKNAKASGASVCSVAETASRTTDEKVRRSKRTGWIVGAVTTAVIVVAVALFLMLSGSDSRDGSYVIWNPDSSVAMSKQIVKEYYLAGHDVTWDENRVAGYNSTCVWQLDFNDDGTFTISFGGKLLGMQAGYNGLGFDGVFTENRWELVQADGGLYYIRNTQTGYYLEWFAQKNNWATHPDIDSENYTLFCMQLDKVS